MTHKMIKHAAEMLEWLEANPGHLLTYPGLAEELDWSVTTTQHVYRYLCHIYDGGNLVVPAPFNDFKVGLQLEPGKATYDGAANQERHARTRLHGTLHRIMIMAATAENRPEKDALNALAKHTKAQNEQREAMAEMLQAFADMKKDD